MFHPCSGKIIWSLTCRANDGYIDIIIYIYVAFICSFFCFGWYRWYLCPIGLLGAPVDGPEATHPELFIHGVVIGRSQVVEVRDRSATAHIPRHLQLLQVTSGTAFRTHTLVVKKKLLELARKIARRKKQTWITWINELRMSLSTYLYYHIILIYLVVDLCSMCSSI